MAIMGRQILLNSTFLYQETLSRKWLNQVDKIVLTDSLFALRATLSETPAFTDREDYKCMNFQDYYKLYTISA